MLSALPNLSKEIEITIIKIQFNALNKYQSKLKVSRYLRIPYSTISRHSEIM